MKYLILGAGPAGLTAAVRLKQRGETSLLLLEKEAQAGGLCRSIFVDGAPFDIGGGHFLDVKRPKVTDFLFQFMPREEWNIYERNSQIKLGDTYIHHPLEANIWELPETMQIDYLESVSRAGCNIGVPMPQTFKEWIRWKLGDRITDDYMLPYNQKMFSEELNELGTYWLEKLPNVSYEEILKSCRHCRAYGTQPGHAHFYYPKRTGYGEVWSRIADYLKQELIYNVNVKKIDFVKKSVFSSEGACFQADVIINTIPWQEFEELKGIPENLVTELSNLKHSSVETRYFQETLNTDAQWIYCPDQEQPYHRILVRSNFCPKSIGYWTETRKERIYMFLETEQGKYRYENKYAYPLNTVKKPKIMKMLLSWCEYYQVYGLGRWGEHQHYNSDAVVELAMKMIDKL